MTDLLGSLDQETLRRKRRQFEAEKQELEIKVKKGVLQALKKHFPNESDEEILTNHGDVAKKRRNVCLLIIELPWIKNYPL